MSREVRKINNFSTNLKKIQFSGQTRSTEFSDNIDVAISPVKWTHELQIWLSSTLNKMTYPYRYHKIKCDCIKLRTQIRYFQIALDGYLESKNPVMSARDVIFWATQFKGAEILKKIRIRSFIKSNRGSYLAHPSDFYDYPSYSIRDIGDIFYYKYCFHFIEETDAYLEGFIPLSQDEGMLQLFREKVRSILDDLPDCDEIDHKEIFMINSGSSSRVNGKSIPHWLTSPREKCKLADSIGTVHRSIIQVGPDNVRDSVTLSPSKRNTVVLMEKQTRVCLKKLSTDSMNLASSELLKDLEKTFYDFPYILSRDLHKEGITKPRNLLRIMIEELYKRFKFKIFSKSLFYEDFELEFNNEILKPVRGHGLGMANSLTSLMQDAVVRIILDQQDSEGQHINSIVWREFNDDYLVGFNSEEDLNTYWDIEESVLSKLGLIRKDSKCFEMYDAGVLCEEYFSYMLPHINDKESIWRRNSLLALTCINVTQAKDYVASLSDKNEFVDDYLEEIINFWGYEFFREEFKLPYKCGGWLNYNIFGVSFDLQKIQQNFDVRAYCAFEACRDSKFKYGRSPKSYEPQYYELFPILDIEDQHKKHFDILNTYQMMEKYYQKKLDVTKSTRIWKNLNKQRIEIYNKRRKSIPFEEFAELYKIDSVDYIPLDYEIDYFVDTELHNGSLEDIYTSVNPKISYLISKGLISDSDIPDEFSIENCIKSKRISANLPTCDRKVNDKLNLLINDFNDIATSSDKEFLSSYINPHCVGTAWTLLHNRFKVPVLKKQYRSPMISKKLDLYKKVLTYDEELLLSRFNKRRTIRKVIQNCEAIDITIEEFCMKLEENIQIQIELLKEDEDKIISYEETQPSQKEKVPEYYYDKLEDFANWLGAGQPPNSGPLNEFFNLAWIQLSIEDSHNQFHYLHPNRKKTEKKTSHKYEIVNRIVAIYREALDAMDHAFSDSEGGYGIDF